MLTIVCERCGTHVTRPKGAEGRGRFCSIRCGRLAQVMPSRSERFWKKVKKGPDCWEWTGTKNTTLGHGVMREGPRGASKQLFAHRVSWELHNGPIPDGMWVLHRCDNPPCVRPDHLYVGTPADNVRDREARGRSRVLRGSRNARATTDEQTILTLRARVADGETIAAAAQALGLSYPTAYLAVKRRSWRHI